jgi:predicted GIY-YIG superfamily endonuclease
MIISLDSNDTYIGSSNNQPNRLYNHNRKGKYGAKRTRGHTWIPALIISGFLTKNACLSFESGWKRLSKKRNSNRLLFINLMTSTLLQYSNDPKWNRIMDLLYFVHNITFIGNKFMINHDMRHPLFEPDNLIINIFMEEWIEDLPWPHFIRNKSILC